MESHDEASDEDASSMYFHFSDLSSELLKSLNAGPSQRSRLRYTCSDVSPNVTPILESPARFLALGTTSGSVHVSKISYFPPPDTSQAPSVFSSTTSIVTDEAHPYAAPPTSHPSAGDSVPSHASIHHFVTIIHEDLIGPVTSVAFAPVQLVLTRTHEEVHEPSLATSEDSDQSSPSSESQDSGDHGVHVNGNAHPHHNAPQRSAEYSLQNLTLSIGSSKGSLLLVDLDLQEKVHSSAFFKLSYKNSSSSRKWQVTYQCSTFTRQSISLLRWDNSNRLFIGDLSGKLFVLHDVDEMRHLMLLSTPTLLLNLDGATIYQLDIAEKLLFLSTDLRTYLFNLDDGKLTPIGKAAKRSKRKEGVIHLSGVCALSTYRLVELNSFRPFSYENTDDSDTGDELTYSETPKAFRLVGTSTQFFATRPKSRLWVVDLEGAVQFTQEYSELVQTTASSPIDGNSVALEKILAPEGGPETTSLAPNFGKVYSMYWRHPYDTSLAVFSYLVSYSNTDRPQIYVVDPNHQTILASSPPLKGQIVELKCIGNDIFVTYQGEPGASLRLCIFTLAVKHNFDVDRRTSLGALSASSLSQESLANEISPSQPEVMPTADGLLTDHNDNEIVHLRRESILRKDSRTASITLEAINLERAQFLFDSLESINGDENGILSKCHCGLPVPSRFRCPQFASLPFQDVLGSAPALEGDIVCHLLRMSFSAGNWPLYMHLLSEMGESKFYLYFAILLDEPCLIARHWHTFGRHTANIEALWQDIIEFIGRAILDPAIESSFTSLSPVSMADKQLTNSSELVENTASLVPGTEHCILCRLKGQAQMCQWVPIISWFESRLLRHTLYYCSTEFVTGVLLQIIDKLPSQPKVAQGLAPQGLTGQSTFSYLISTELYLHLLHFEIMQLSTVQFSKNILTNLKQQFLDKSDTDFLKRANSSVKRRHSEAKSRLSVSSDAPLPIKQVTGRVLNLSEIKCAFCEQSILKSRKMSSEGLVKVYRNCEHVFHSTCTLTRRCSRCHRR